MISAFRGRWTKLGNYSSCVVFFEGHAYQSVELAKKLARTVPLRADWDTIKIHVMRTLLREKFSQEPERSILLATGSEELVEGNWWHDRFWGQCPLGTGENWLGRLLMEVRAELQQGDIVPPSEG